MGRLKETSINVTRMNEGIPSSLWWLTYKVK